MEKEAVSKPLSEKDKLEAERRELNLLIGRGITFDVKRTVHKKRPGLLGIFHKRIPTATVESFMIHEPTLSTLDKMAALQIELSIDEEKMRSGEALSEARRLTGEHSRRMARIIALAVMGQDYVTIRQTGARQVYMYDNKGLDELTEILFHGLTPSQMAELVVYINTMSNLGDFCNSIRLMSAVRTTMPTLVEADKEG